MSTDYGDSEDTRCPVCRIHGGPEGVREEWEKRVRQKEEEGYEVCHCTMCQDDGEVYILGRRSADVERHAEAVG